MDGVMVMLDVGLLQVLFEANPWVLVISGSSLLHEVSKSP